MAHPTINEINICVLDRSRASRQMSAFICVGQPELENYLLAHTWPYTNQAQILLIAGWFMPAANTIFGEFIHR